MDFKGITWAGNVYQKFEAMCLEVEEAMYQDTAKYVENQVQKVSVTMKNFYSDVMEDLLPPSCVYPVNSASGDSSLNYYSETDTDMKPKPSVFDSHCDLNKKENEDQVMPYVTAEKESCPISYYDIISLSTTNKFSKSSAAASKKVGVQKRPVGIKRISRNNLPSKDSGRTTSLSGDGVSTLATCDTSSSSRMASVDINMMSSLDLNVSRSVNENASNPDTPAEPLASDKILSAESLMRNEDDSEEDSSNPATVKVPSAETVKRNEDDSDSISADFENNSLGESERLKGDSESATSCSGLPTGRIDGSSSVRASSCNSESRNKEIIVSNEDSFDMEVIENEEVAEQRLESFQREKLEESCVMVEGDKLHYIPRETRKQKSYKKKIREALSSKLRSRKDPQHASPHKDLGQTTNANTVAPVATVSEKQNLPARDYFESDWELL